MTLSHDEVPPGAAPDAPAPVVAGAGDGDAHHGKNASAPIADERKVEKPIRLKELTDLNSIREYLNRVGAEPRSLKGAVVKEASGKYFRDVATIKFSKTREIDCSSLEHAPTDLERANIAVELATVQWPELQPLSSIFNQPDMIAKADKKHIYEFRNTAGKIVMIQVRIEKDGEKNYVPWTFWDDQEWRMCEPDGPLPLYGADKLAEAGIVFIHEGAKAARHVAWMVAGETAAARKALADHPWGRELANAAHVGWIGGAPSPHRTDWATLKQAGITRAYIVADNDEDGVAAVPKISKLLCAYPMSVSVVRFDNRFPPNFDLADTFPKGHFAGGEPVVKNYNGPSFRDCLRPATWATRSITPPKSTGKGRPAALKYSLRKEFRADWWIVAGEGKPMYVQSSDPTQLYDETGFNVLVQPFRDVPTTAALLKTHIDRQVEAVGYEPGDDQGEIIVDGVRCVNTWAGPAIRPATLYNRSNAQPFDGFMEQLFLVEGDRLQVMRWCATLIARPKVRMRYGLLLLSTTQGVGKTTLCDIMRKLVGEKNCSEPSEKQVVDSAFNSWIARKRLVIVNEIYQGNSVKAYNQLKSAVTDDALRVNEKNKPEYSIANKAHFILCSNDEAALRVGEGDRRFLVPEITETKPDPSFWVGFHAWLNAGATASLWAGRKTLSCSTERLDRAMKPRKRPESNGWSKMASRMGKGW